MSDVSAREPDRKRPILVWLISAFVLFSAAWSLAGLWLLVATPEEGELAGEMARMRALIGPVDIAFIAVLVALNIAGAVALFRLKRVAATIFGAVVAVTLLNQLWVFLFNRGLLADQNPIPAIAGVVLPLLFFMYASRLVRRGVLA